MSEIGDIIMWADESKNEYFMIMDIRNHKENVHLFTLFDLLNGRYESWIEPFGGNITASRHWRQVA